MITSPVICLLLAALVQPAVIFHEGQDGLEKYKYVVSDNTVNKYNAADENSINYWRDQGRAAIKNKIETPQITTTAKNVIMFLGDGMSIPTVSAARIYLGQLSGTAGENERLSFEKFPYTGLSKTYCVDFQVADSACTATAYLGGVKANMGTLGVSAAVPRGNCSKANDPNNRVHSILKWAQDAGKGTGIVTTTRITHASPGGNFAAVAERNFESDFDISKSTFPEAALCRDIAKQLVMDDPGKNVKVILGGGRAKFLPNTTADPESGFGERLDGIDLIKEWQDQKEKQGSVGRYVWNRTDLLNTDISKTDYLFGLFEPSHMKYHLEANSEAEPTLEELTRIAIKMLQKEHNGFYLFVEGGRIDHGHHENWARRALDETVEMHKAVQAAVEMTDIQDTLIVVTSDHAHTMSFSGYPARGEDILGTSGMSDVDKMPYTTISYANGPSAEAKERSNPNNSDLRSDTYRYPSLVKLVQETHGGDDVGVFARGPFAHLFIGVYEQNVIPYIMSYSGDFGPAAKSKSDEDVVVTELRGSASTQAISLLSIIVCVGFFFVLQL